VDGCRDGAIIGGGLQWLLPEEREFYGLFLWFWFFLPDPGFAVVY
jgi:hypothetical protein